MRKLTDTQVAALASVEANPGTSIKEVAQAIDGSYGKAQQALARLDRLELLRVERLRSGGWHKNIYYPLERADPDSDDPLERAFAAPAAEKRTGH